VKKRFAAVWCLLLLLALGLAACGVPGESNKGPESVQQRPGQADLLASVVNDRKHLFDGSLAYDPSVSVSVGGSLTYDVRLTSRGEKSSRGTAQVALVTRAFQVGGVEEATLSAGDSAVRVVLLSPRVKQVIAQPGDPADWQWSVSATEPGDYDLTLTVTTLQGDSDRALDTLTPPITVHLTVHNTWSHRFASMQNWLYAAAGSAGALAGIYALRAPLTELVRGRREARQRRNEGRDGYM
jgi:hypothetical protein